MLFDVGLLSPVTAGHDDAVSDAAVLDALVTAEVALARAWATASGSPQSADHLSRLFGWREAGALCAGHGLDAEQLARDAVAGGNPVIPLVKQLRERAGDAGSQVHRGATSQDIVDSALMLLARRAGRSIDETLAAIEQALTAFAQHHRDTVAAARTLTQHAVPTTVGLRAANWLRAVRRARRGLADAVAALPAQLGGAAGTLASFTQLGGVEMARVLPAAFAAQLGLAAPEAPWHTTRWPVTELGDALARVIDAAGLIATDAATLSRTEIGELSEGQGGGSSAMPQKQNPSASVLVRSAALRAPQLGATLHLAAALAVDERPDGAWHAEWPTLRELLRLTLGATASARRLVEGLRVDEEAVARNLALTDGSIVSERLSIVLTPLIGADEVGRIVADAARGEALADLVRETPGTEEVDVDDLLDPAQYTGLAGVLVDDVVDAGVAKDPEEES